METVVALTSMFSLIFLFAASGMAQADVLRIGSWNIQDLHHEENFSLRDFGSMKSVKRTSDDFKLLEKYRDMFGRNSAAADVIALQEIGTKSALERLFPSEEYERIMSPRWKTDDAAEGKGDVYTAIAVRRDSGVKVLALDPLPGLSVTHADGRPTRAGTGAVLEKNGQQFALLSVHLKSSCADRKDIHISTDDDCETLWEQTPVLASWIAAKREMGIPFIIAGDFNRRFRQMNFEDTLWEAMNGVGPDIAIVEPWVTPHPISVTRLCPTRKGSSTQPIDWIVLDVTLAGNFVENSYWERRFSFEDIQASQNGAGLSDHCPISIDLELSR